MCMAGLPTVATLIFSKRSLRIASRPTKVKKRDGADVAAELLAAHGFESDRNTVWTAIALHTSFGIHTHQRIRPEVALTAAGVGMDFGTNADLVDEQLAEAIHRAYPR